MSSLRDLILECSVCYAKYKIEEDEGLRPPYICYTCWFNHINTTVTRMSYQLGQPIRSPFQDSHHLDVDECLNSLKKKHRDEIQEIFFKKYTRFTTDIERCPSQTCDFVYISEKCLFGPQKDYNCPKCSATLQHVKRLSLKSLFGSLYFLIFAVQCPKCQIPIERTQGCYHMTCPCGHEFCWYCSKDYKNYTNHYNVHTPKQCSAILLSKISIMIFAGLSILIALTGEAGYRFLTSWSIFIVQSFGKLVLFDGIFIFLVYITAFIFVKQKGQQRNALIFIALSLWIGLIWHLYSLDMLYYFAFLIGIQALIIGVIFGLGIALDHFARTWYEYIM